MPDTNGAPADVKGEISGEDAPAYFALDLVVYMLDGLAAQMQVAKQLEVKQVFLRFSQEMQTYRNRWLEKKVKMIQAPTLQDIKLVEGK